MKTMFAAMLFLSMFMASSVLAEKAKAKQADVAQVVAFMSAQEVYQKALEVKRYDDGGVRIVLVSRGQRYTFYYSGTNDPDPFLSIWVRPNGTYSTRKLDTCTDHGLDGHVEFGIRGNASSDATTKLFNTRDRKVGEEFREYWQDIYNRAIVVALRRLR